MTTLDNLIDQALDIAGTLFQTDGLDRTEEAQQLGRPLSGQSGAAASISGTAPNMTITGLTGMTAASIGHFLTLSGADSAGNNGTFLISQYVSASSVVVQNASGVGGDANNGAISWEERRPWSAEDDHNFHRTDRAAIKGVAYDAAIPTYYRCTDQTTPVAANLNNIAGKTLDAKSLITDRKYENALPTAGTTYITLTAAGQLQHAGGTDTTGIPIYDGYDAGDDEATYAELIADGYQQGLLVLAGANAGNRIFGRMRGGSSTSPNSVEVEWRSVPIDEPIGNSVAYTWEADQPSVIDIYYPYRECLDNLDENALRKTLVNGLIADAGLSGQVSDLYQVIGIDDGDTDLSGQLTNTGMYFPFYNLPDATPSVVEALNTLNAQIGNRDYTGSILTDGYTITQSLQELSDAIEAGTGNYTVTRTIERLSAAVPAGTAHTLPGGLSYTLDGANNGNNLWVYWRKQLRDPGSVANGDDYEETSTTSITPYVRIRADDHINYFIATQ